MPCRRTSWCGRVAYTQWVPGTYFGEAIAERYDSSSAEMFEPALLSATADFLRTFAAGGEALEFGIGTGRVALALSERGVRVHGIDVSEPMVARLRVKPGAEAIGVTIGDIVSTRVPGAFRLVYMPFNVITNLLTQEEQVECYRNAAAHLLPGGFVVAEVWVPSLQRLQPGERFVPFKITPEHLGFDEIDVVDQICISHHYFLDDGKAQQFSSKHRYCWPSELDLMARLAGLEFQERWSDWKRSPFTAKSTDHISVWRKPA